MWSSAVSGKIENVHIISLLEDIFVRRWKRENRAYDRVGREATLQVLDFHENTLFCFPYFISNFISANFVFIRVIYLKFVVQFYDVFLF